MKKNKLIIEPLNIIPSINNLNRQFQSQNDEQFNIYSNSRPSHIDEQSSNSSFQLQKLDDPQDQQDHQNISKLLDKLGLKVNHKNKRKNQDLQMIVNTFVQNCIETVDRKINTEEYEVIYNESYEQELKKQAHYQSSIYISQLTQLEKIKYMEDSGIIWIIKNIRLFLKYISMSCQIIIHHPLFEAFILLVIILNSIKMTTDDPLADQSSMAWAEDIFTGIYVAEMVLKIFALGFMFNKGAYLRDLWNIMDFVIVATSLLPMIISINFSISALRAIRVLRPLRTITKIKALKMIIRTLFHSFSLVVDSLYILLFVLFVFSIAGMQLFGGKLKYNCMVEETGFLSSKLCSADTDCLVGQLCVKGLSSPNFSLTNFDTFFWSFLSVFETITLQGWSQTMQYIQTTSGYIYMLYSLMIVFICEYVLLNMTMAILKYKYGQVKQNALVQQVQQKEQYEPQFLKKIGIYKDLSILSQPVPLTRIKHSSKLQIGCQLSLPFQRQEQLSNQQLFSYIQPPPIVNENADMNKEKINIQQLKKYGRFNDHKWDPSSLKFETNFENEMQIIAQKNDQKSQSNKSEGKIKNDSSIEQQQSQQFLTSSQDDKQSELYENQQLDLVDKAHQLQQKLNHTKNQHSFPLFNTFQSKKIMPQLQHNEVQIKKKHVTKELSQLDYLLSLIGSKPGSTTKPINVVIPQIDFDQNMPNRIYQKFADLGDFKIKRIEKNNELKELNVPLKKKIRETNKKIIISAQQALEDTTLDLIQLHLKNDLQKKKLRCRLKNDEIIDKERTYDITRVIISQKMKEVQKKKEEIKENIHSLNFNVKYKLPTDKNETGPSIYTRNIQAQKILLNIPEKITQLQFKPQRATEKQKQSSKIKNNVNYLRLLQKNQIEQKIQLSYDKIMNKYFKKINYKQQKQIKQQVDYEEQYQNIREDDILKKHGYIQLELPINVYQNDMLISNMNMKKEQFEIHIRGLLGWAIVFRKKLTIFASYSAYDNFMLLIVFLNTILMSMSGFVNTDAQPYQSINLAFTYLFSIDLFIKIIAYGFNFFKDMMNLFDTAVVVISMLEIFMGGGSSNLTALRSIRILRAFRVLRITRLIRSLNYMKIVMGVITSIITQFVYVFLLLFLFIFIYTLLGMQLFGGALHSPQVTGVRQNFDSFFYAFFSIFQVMTTENWNEISKALAVSPAGPWSVIFLISFVFLGNWILLNLLQAILLDGFDDDATDPTKQLDEQNEFDEALNEQSQQQEQDLQDDEKEQQQVSLSKSNTSSQFLKISQIDDSSLYLFQPENCFRKMCTAIISSKIFQTFVFISIITSSLKLALDTYINPQQQSIANSLSKISDYVFNAIFIFQSFCKIISFGFIIGPRTYLKSSWNKLDFFIVCMSIVDMLLSSINLSIIKLLRTLRPLRILTRNENMKIMVNSLIQSLIGIFNVMIICLCVFLMFAILGMNLLQGKLNYCNLQGPQLQVDFFGPYGINKAACQAQGGVWALQLINFQNIVSSMLSLYIFSTRQNWPYYVFTFIDGTQQGPVKDSSKIVIFIYAILFIFIGSLFFMDLLIGVMFMNYHQAEAKIRPKILTDKQINWKNLQKIIVSQNPCFKLYLKPENPIRQYFFNIVDKKLFEIGIGLIIVINIIVMAISNDDISSTQSLTYQKINTACSYIFICQLTLKLIAYGKHYFLSSWNIFDFFVVSASVLDIILDFAGASNQQNSSLSALPQIARIFRVLRITRLLRMFKQFKGLQKLIETFIFSLPAIGKGLSLLLLYLFITSILASYLMNGIQGDNSGFFTNILHYRDFHNSIQLLYVNLTGQNWYYFMFFSTNDGYVQCQPDISCVSALNYLFWLPFVFIGQKVILQLFALIVLDEFQANYINQNNPLGIFSLYEEDFRDNWIIITSKYNANKIETKKLIDLLLSLRPPLGLGRQQTLKKYKDQLQQNDKISPQEINLKMSQLEKKLRKSAAKILHKMNIMKNRIYFGYHQTFYHFTKLAHFKDFIENASPQQLDMLDNLHKESQKQLEKVLPEGNLYYFQQLENEQQSNVPLNPISLILFTQMIMKSWYNYSVKSKSKNFKKIERQQIYDSLNNSCASDVQQVKFEKITNHKLGGRRQGLIQEKQLSQQRKCEFKPIPNMYAAYSEGKLTKYKLQVPQDRLKLKKTSSSRRSKGGFLVESQLKTLYNSSSIKPQ